MHVETPTKLPLATFARIMGVNPLHFAGVQLTGANGAPNLQQGTCETAWMQYEYQDADRVGREELARAIAQAEADLEAQLGYRLLPSWEVDEWARPPGTNRPELVNLTYWNPRGFALTAQARWAKFLAGGIRATSTIQAGAGIAYSDTDGDNYKETATVTVASTVTPCEVHAYHPGHAGDPMWEIRPITVTAAGGNLTITFRRELAAKPSLLEGFDAVALDGTTDANFETTVDVVRVYNDPATMTTLMWESIGIDCENDTEVGQYGTQTGVLHGRDADLGILAYEPATYDPATGVFTRQSLAVTRTPDVVRLWYLAGLADNSRACPRLEMDPDWARTVAIFASSKLDRPPCSCTTNWFERWQADLAFAGGADEKGTYTLSDTDRNNPFGTRRGAIYAWRRVADRSASVRGTVLI